MLTVLLLSSGYLIGGHVMRLCHGHDESLTIPGADQSEEEQRLANKSESSSSTWNKQLNQLYLRMTNQKEMLSNSSVNMLFD